MCSQTVENIRIYVSSGSVRRSLMLRKTWSTRERECEPTEHYRIGLAALAAVVTPKRTSHTLLLADVLLGLTVALDAESLKREIGKSAII